MCDVRFASHIWDFPLIDYKSKANLIHGKIFIEVYYTIVWVLTICQW